MAGWTKCEILTDKWMNERMDGWNGLMDSLMNSGEGTCIYLNGREIIDIPKPLLNQPCHCTAFHRHEHNRSSHHSQTIIYHPYGYPHGVEYVSTFFPWAKNSKNHRNYKSPVMTRNQSWSWVSESQSLSWSWSSVLVLLNENPNWRPRLNSFIHSFISNIYIAPLQERLLRGAPNSSAAKKSLQMREERER